MRLSLRRLLLRDHRRLGGSFGRGGCAHRTWLRMGRYVVLLSGKREQAGNQENNDYDDTYYDPRSFAHGLRPFSLAFCRLQHMYLSSPPRSFSVTRQCRLDFHRACVDRPCRTIARILRADSFDVVSHQSLSGLLIVSGRTAYTAVGLRSAFAVSTMHFENSTGSRNITEQLKHS